MSDFNKEKLVVNFGEGISKKAPIEPRKYTLTHSDETGELFLSIGKCYDYTNITAMRDEVLGTWICDLDSNYSLKLEILVDGCGDDKVSERRNKIFRKELPLAIKAIIYGDRAFIEELEFLNESKIKVKFKSRYDKYNVEENWGLVKDYVIQDCDNEYRTFIDGGNIGLPGGMGLPGNVGLTGSMGIPGNIGLTGNMGSTGNIGIPGTTFNPNKYPIPFPPGIEYPPATSPKNKHIIIEDALITMLKSHIEAEVYLSYGKDAPYCLKAAEIIDARVRKSYGPCRQEYEITVGLRVGKKMPQYNNMIITFIINDNRVVVKSVKNPRD